MHFQKKTRKGSLKKHKLQDKVYKLKSRYSISKFFHFWVSSFLRFYKFWFDFFSVNKSFEHYLYSLRRFQMAYSRNYVNNNGSQPKNNKHVNGANVRRWNERIAVQMPAPKSNKFWWYDDAFLTICLETF